MRGGGAAEGRAAQVQRRLIAALQRDNLSARGGGEVLLRVEARLGGLVEGDLARGESGVTASVGQGEARPGRGAGAKSDSSASAAPDATSGAVCRR